MLVLPPPGPGPAAPPGFPPGAVAEVGPGAAGGLAGGPPEGSAKELVLGREEPALPLLMVRPGPGEREGGAALAAWLRLRRLGSRPSPALSREGMGNGVPAVLRRVGCDGGEDYISQQRRRRRDGPFRLWPNDLMGYEVPGGFQTLPPVRLGDYKSQHAKAHGGNACGDARRGKGARKL